MSTVSPSRARASIAEAAEYWNVSTDTVRRWAKSGHIHAERHGPKLIRIDLDSLRGEL